MVRYSPPSGFLVIMHPSQMFVPEVKTLYNGILADSSSSINLKIQILKNLQTYLQEEDTRMQEADRECKQICGCCCSLPLFDLVVLHVCIPRFQNR